MEHRIPLLGLIFSLLFSLSAFSQECIDYTFLGNPPADYTGTVVGNSFVAAPACLGVLTEVEIKKAPGGGNMPAQLKIYLGVIDGSEVEIYSQNFSMTPGDNMIQIDPEPGQTPPCLMQGAIYTFTIASAMSFSLQGYPDNPYAAGQVFTNTGGYDPQGDLFFSITASGDSEISVTGNGFNIPYNDMSPELQDGTDFGMPFVGSSVTQTFVIYNIGTESMQLTGTPFVQLTGDPEFTVTTQPPNGTLAPGAFRTFSITYTPTVGMVQNFATVVIPNNDCNESPFVFLITGKGLPCDLPDIPVLQASGTLVCPDTEVSISIQSGDLNDAENWMWYDDVCGGNLIGMGTSISVTPLATTTYYVRGEGGCVTPGDCAEITIVVGDEENPEITCPASFSLEVGANCEALIPDLTNAQVSDNCDLSAIVVTQSPLPGTVAGPGMVTVELIVTDGFDNTASCTVNISIEDNTLPVASCQDISVSLDAFGEAQIISGQIDQGSSDNCGIESLTLDVQSFGCDDVGELNVVTLTVLDVNGNENTCTAEVTVLDDTPPIALCNDVDVFLNALGDGTLLPEDVDDGSSDNCGIASLELDVDQFGCGDVGEVITVTLTVADDSGNESTCQATVTVSDVVIPDAICQDITVTLDASGNAVIAPEDIDNGSNDACGVESLELDIANFDCNSPETVEVTLTVTDFNGNVQTCTAIVTIEETTEPVAVCQDIIVELDEAGFAAIEPEDINNGSGDACGLASLEASQTEFDCSDVGENMVTLTVTDNNGNVGTCIAVVTIADVTPPVAVCQSVTVELDATGAASITPAQIDNGSSDACGIASYQLDITDFSCEDVGENTVILTVTDVNDNQAPCSAVVTVLDNIFPVALCEPDFTAELDENGEAALSVEDIDNGSFDNCNLNLSISVLLLTCDNLGATVVTLTAADEAGNESTCTTTVTVEDNTPPAAVCENVSIQLDQNGFAEVAGSLLDGGTTDNCGIDEFKPAQEEFTCADLGVNEVVVTVTDNSGNISTCTAMVTVLDLLDPVAVCQNAIVQLNPGGTLTLSPTAVDGGTTDNCSLTLSLDINQFNCDEVGVHTVILTAEDPSGNTDNCSATVTILASPACPVPDIKNFGGPNVEDPCTCLTDGQFAEEIVIGPTLAGMEWEIALNNGFLNPMTLQPYPAGTEFIEIPINIDSSIYVLEGIHLDGIGYAIEAESAFFPDVTLAIANVCYYPDPQIIGLSSQYCLNSTPIDLEGSAGGADLLDEFFTINGIPAIVFDPMALGLGTHTVTYTVNAGTATPNDPSDPGCVASVSQTVEVTNESPGTLVCNDLVFVSVDENCEALITPDMVLEGDYYCYDDFQIDIFYNLNQIPNPVTSAYIGLTLTYNAVNMNNWNFCSGQLIIADLLEPMIFCQAEPFEVGCDEDLSIIPPPLVIDNCTVGNIELISETYLDTEICDDGVVIIEQVWLATDLYGNESEPCTRLIEIQRTSADLIDFPNDITWSCQQYAQYPNIIGANPVHPTILVAQQGINPINATVFNLSGFLAGTGSGTPSGIQGTFCEFAFTYSDQTVPTCGTSFQIIRTWTVLDMCTGELITGNESGEDNIQIITVADVTPPVVSVPAFTLSANIPGSAPGTCLSQGLLPPPVVTDDCNTWTYKIFTPIGEAIYLPNGWGAVPAPGLPLGTHVITYQATDICGNTTNLQVTVEVIDDIAPTAICDEITDVNLSSDGLAVVNATTFDDGSWDNCCVEEFLVRRLDGDCEGDYDPFSPTVTFCCTDVENNPIAVIMRVVDCFGNYNDCQVEVNVNDKIYPMLLYCPESAEISCEEYNETYMMPLALGDNSVLDDFGTAQFLDNCLNTLNVGYQVQVLVNNCGNGVITRYWTASDDAGNGPVYCNQSIQVYHVSDWVVEFPADVTVQCTAGQMPDPGEPEIFFDECEMIATSYTDIVYTIVSDACYKIERTWNVINWCIYDQYGSDIYPENGKSEANLNIDWDGDGDKDSRTFRDGWNSSGSPGVADGYITYKQIIKVIDEDDPVFSIPTIDGCILDADCTTDLVLPYPQITDECSLDFRVDITGNFGNFYDISGPVTVANVEAGEYTIGYSVRDNCGNIGFQTVTIVVEDCLKPLVVCEDLIVDIMQTGMVEIEASAFDEGSLDNCGPVTFSFSPNTNDVSLVFTCDDLPQVDVEIWVTDISGNQDFCEVTLYIQDNLNACNQVTPPTIAGLITNEDDEALEGAMVEVNEGSWSQMTSANGLFSFDLPAGGDYSIAPVLDENAANGVTTYDMVLIQRHILGVNMLNSPYKVIAADANRSGSVSTLDLVAIRKVILHLTDVFPNNTSWRFVAASHAFGSIQNPWQTPFPEVLNYNNLAIDDLDADFIAIKVGDVNGSATVNAMGNANERTVTGNLSFYIPDREAEAGELFEAPFFGDGQEVFGYQYTLELGASLELVELRQGIAKEDNFGFAKLGQGALTTSWNEAMPRRLGREEVQFTLVLRAKDRVRLSEALAASSRFTAAEAYDPNGELLDVRLAFGAIEKEEDFALYQNEPNPFSEVTTIRFHLPEASQATLTVIDAAGRIIATRSGRFDRGVHEVRLDELGETTGVMYYRLETPEHTATRKMVKVK
jgi:hypothetical protein